MPSILARPDTRRVCLLEKIRIFSQKMTRDHIATAPPPQQANDHIARLPLLHHESGEPVTDAASWAKRRSEIASQWWDYLGPRPFAELPSAVREEPEEDMGEGFGRRVWIQTAPDYEEACYLLRPRHSETMRKPAVVIFYYNTDTPTARTPNGKPGEDHPNVRAFAWHLMQRGYVTFTQRWFCEGYRDPNRSPDKPLSERYRGSVARFNEESPVSKGMARVVGDAQRCVDYLQTLPFVDGLRIGCMGHSLGGKMSLYAAAFEPRFAVCVASELGIGLSFSNWDAPWYLDAQVREPDFHLDHHQLLALFAPRPFLLIAGENTDSDASWAYLNTVDPVYRLLNAPERVGMFNHRTGHSPTPGATEAAYTWFDRWL